MRSDRNKSQSKVIIHVLRVQPHHYSFHSSEWFNWRTIGWGTCPFDPQMAGAMLHWVHFPSWSDDCRFSFAKCRRSSSLHISFIRFRSMAKQQTRHGSIKNASGSSQFVLSERQRWFIPATIFHFISSQTNSNKRDQVSSRNVECQR